MDELEKRLRKDADQIVAEPSVDLQRRIDASLEAARIVGPASLRRPAPPRRWISALTGLATAVAVIAYLNWNPEASAPVPFAGSVDDDVASAVIDEPGTDGQATLPPEWGVDGKLPLRIRPALLTRSLEEELINLQSDLEKARENLERDVKETF